MPLAAAVSSVSSCQKGGYFSATAAAPAPPLEIFSGKFHQSRPALPVLGRLILTTTKVVLWEWYVQPRALY